MANSAIKGIIAPILTPMTEGDQRINTDILREEIERLIASGVDGIFCFGTNGEGYILSEHEKYELLEAAVDQVKGRISVYAGTGCISTEDTIRLSRTAQKLGADILSIITPYFALASQKELYDHYSEVAKHVDIPIVLYNIPARTGNKLLPETVAKLAKDVDVIRGVKDSSGDLDNLLAYIEQTKNLAKDFKVLSGNDSLILKTLLAGGAGGIAGCANVYPHVLSSIYDLFMEGKIEEAEQAQASIASFRAVFKYGNPNTIVKKAVKFLGYAVGDCRRPFNYLSEEGVRELKTVLEENQKAGMC
ncbi:MAG: 4-hydroxy-tetrahydrodipicolinate synthase [Eubacteriales bacterium]|nr:4-hydroxy-tetrahydrodipicolinate synthase [Eubacteriales bacterium]